MIYFSYGKVTKFEITKFEADGDKFKMTKFKIILEQLVIKTSLWPFVINFECIVAQK